MLPGSGLYRYPHLLTYRTSFRCFPVVLDHHGDLKVAEAAYKVERAGELFQRLPSAEPTEEGPAKAPKAPSEPEVYSKPLGPSGSIGTSGGLTGTAPGQRSCTSLAVMR